MASRTKKRRDDPAPPRAPASKRRRDDDEDDDDEESSESELSDLNEELEEETMNTLVSGATKRGLRDEDDESDDDSDEDTPEEREEEYVYEDEKDVSDPEVDSPAPKKKPFIKPPPASRTSSRRKSAATTARTSKAGPSNLSNVSRPGDVSMKDSITVAGSRRAATTVVKKGQQQTRGVVGGAKPEQTIRLTLKMGKDKLREATSAWTPPPVTAADSMAGGTAESSSAEDSNGLPARAGRGRKTVEEDEESSEEDDEERDDAEEDAEGEEVEEDEDEDAEGEDDDGLNDEDAEGETDDEEMIDSDDDDDGTGVNTPDFRSRTGTPDMSRLTKRQKSRLDEVYSADLLELPTGIERPSAAKAIPLTADEQALKRAEMARRRKNLTDQRLEEEKIDTINKLLKKQTPKMRKNGRDNTTGAATPANEAEPGSTESYPVPKMVRWVSNKNGIRVGVPNVWLSGPIGRVFQAQSETDSMKLARARGGGRLIEEIEERQGTVPMEIEV